MQVHHAARLGQARVQAGMQVPGRGIGRILTRQSLGVVRVEQQELPGRDAREMPAAGIHQELRAVSGYRDAQMIGHRFVHVEAREPAERRGQVHA
jgi:hypothetical protein